VKGRRNEKIIIVNIVISSEGEEKVYHYYVQLEKHES